MLILEVMRHMYTDDASHPRFEKLDRGCRKSRILFKLLLIVNIIFKKIRRKSIIPISNRILPPTQKLILIAVLEM